MVEWKTVRIKKDTHEYLIGVKALLEAQHKREVSMDETIKSMAKYTPKVKITWEGIKGFKF